MSLRGGAVELTFVQVVGLPIVKDVVKRNFD